MINRKKAIIAHIFKYASAQYFSQFVGFFNAVFMRRLLGPVYMGVYSLLKVILEYGSYTSVGADTTLCYKLPMLRGQGDEEGASRMNKVIFNFVMTTSFVYALSILVYALISRKTYSPEMFIGLIVISVLVLIQRVSSYYINVLRSYKDFHVLSIIIVFEAITNLLLTVFVVGKFKIYGLYAALIVMPVLIIICIKLLSQQRLKFSFDFTGIVAHIKFSIPLFINDGLSLILYSIDRIMIAGMLGLEQLGFYSIAIMVRTYGGGIANNFAVVIQPYFMESIGRKDDAETAQKYIVISSMITAYMMSFILSCIYIAATPFIYYVLPKFVPGLAAMQIFLVVTFFVTMVQYYYDYLVSQGKQIRTIPFAVIAIAVSFTFNYISIKRGLGITGVAASTAIGAILSFIMVSVYSLAHIKKERILTSLATVLYPLLYSVCVLAILARTVILANMALSALVRLIIFFIAFLPAIYYLNNKTGIVRIFFTMLTDRFKRKMVK
jgi:lipopolysaccharide exporter